MTSSKMAHMGIVVIRVIAISVGCACCGKVIPLIVCNQFVDDYYTLSYMYQLNSLVYAQYGRQTIQNGRQNGQKPYFSLKFNWVLNFAEQLLDI